MLFSIHVYFCLRASTYTFLYLSLHQENSLEIRSYSIELLTIFEWLSVEEGNPGTDKLFRKVMKQLATCETLQVGFDDNYKCSAYPRSDL